MDGNYTIYKSNLQGKELIFKINKIRFLKYLKTKTSNMYRLIHKNLLFQMI